MNRRLQQFLELENITPARLAEILGVQRSGLSHILSGRNKPGYDFIYKLLTKFPELNAEWFITGKGKPYKKSESYPAPSVEAGPGDLFNSGEQQFYRGEFKSYNEEKKVSEDWKKDESFQNGENTSYESENKELVQDFNLSQLNENEKFSNTPPSIGKNRRIKRVTIFYNDGTFEELGANS